MTPAREIILQGDIEGQQVSLRIAVEPFGVPIEMRKAILDYFQTKITEAMQGIVNVPIDIKDPRQKDLFHDA